MYWYPNENLLRLKGYGHTTPKELTAGQPWLLSLHKKYCMQAAKKRVHSNLSLLGLASDLANLSKVKEGDELIAKRIELYQSDLRAKRCSAQRLNALRMTHGTVQIK